jgi:hypothetical protein
MEAYGVPFFAAHGFNSATKVHDLAETEACDERRYVFLYVGDWDPSGMYMSEVDLPGRLQKYGATSEFDLVRIALSKDDLGDLPFFSAKEKDPRYRWFVNRYFLVKHKGYKPEQLSPVCDSPAVQAWITSNAERAGIRGLNTRNGPVEDVMLGFAREGIFFDSINLDFTSPISKPLLISLAKIGQLLRFQTIVSITILRGRESESFFSERNVFVEAKDQVLEGMADEQAWRQEHGIPAGMTLMDQMRLILLQQCFYRWDGDRVVGGWCLGMPKFGFYKSASGQTMLHYRGIALHNQNVRFLLDYARRPEWERLEILKSIPETERENVLAYSKLMNFKPADYGMLH